MNDHRRIITNIRPVQGTGPFPSAPAGLVPMEITFQDGSTTIRDLRPVPGRNFKYQGSFNDEIFVLGVGIEAESHEQPRLGPSQARAAKERPLGLL